MKVAVLLAKNVFALWATMASASAIDDVIQRKLHGRVEIATGWAGVVRAEKGIILVISNKDISY